MTTVPLPKTRATSTSAPTRCFARFSHLRQAVLLRAVTCAAVLGALAVTVPGQPSEAAGRQAAGLARPAYIASADYFGDGDPLNAWSSDMADAPQVFAQMKSNGFNAVGLVLPWGEFQQKLSPPTMNSTAISQLNRLIADAAQLHMGVILRLSYEWDPDPYDQMPGTQRFLALWSTQHVYASWLNYISALHADVSRFGNVWEAYLSWEDLWEPVFDTVGTTTSAQRLSLAGTTGYRTWLKSTMTLAQVDAAYGSQYASWADVPTPTGHRPSYRLMFEYQDWALEHRLFLPAEKRFPGLTLESRVDVDPIHTGTQVVGSYPHTVQFQLPGTSVTGVYFSPYIGDPTSTPNETAADAIQAMQNTLSSLSSKSGGRRLFIYEYEFGRNSAAVAGNPEVIPAQLPTFISQSEPILKRYTAGYALWTYRDYELSGLFNPSFTLGSQGWALSGGAHVVDANDSGSRLALSANASAVQKLAGAPTGPSTVSFEADASKPTAILVRTGSGPAQTVRLRTGSHSYNVTVPGTSVATLTLRATGPASVTDVQLYNTPQLGNIYSITGKPGVSVAPLRSLNKALTAPG